MAPWPAFPLSELVGLIIKQSTRPLTSSITSRASNSKIFKKVLLPTAQFFHTADVKVRMRILNLGKVTQVPKLDEKRAFDVGVQLLSEFAIFCIASGILIFEYHRQAAKEELKQDKNELDKRELKGYIESLEEFISICHKIIRLFKTRCEGR